MHPKLLESTVAQCRAYIDAGDCHGEAPPTERLIAAVVEMDEEIAQLVRALRAEVEPQTFMGEPITPGVAPAGAAAVLRDVVRCLRETGRYVDEEGEETDRLQELLDALPADGVLAQPTGKTTDAAGVPPSDALASLSSVVFPAALVGKEAAGAYYRADDVRRLLASGVRAVDAVPDDVWEALQRLIENAETLGPASQEDAKLVARWRGRFVPAREAALGVSGMAEPIFCPFCGTKHSLIPDCDGRYQQIVCGACGARGPEVYRWLPYRTAVESWNVRAEPSDVNETHRPSGVRVEGGTSNG